MKCLSCWNEIRDHVAILTKSCKHLFCKNCFRIPMNKQIIYNFQQNTLLTISPTHFPHENKTGKLCSEKAFKKELSCPLCDTVLAKDGITEISLEPNESNLTKSAATIFGFQPQEMCQVLQLGLDFWAKQKSNETIKFAHDTKNLKIQLEEINIQNARLVKVIEDERLKKKSLQHEKEALKSQISELESRYAEKTRSLRKMTELYNALRQIHKRLLHDLGGARDDIALDIDENDSDPLPKSAIEIKTVKQSDNREIPADVISNRTEMFSESLNVDSQRRDLLGRTNKKRSRIDRFDAGENPAENIECGEIQPSYKDSNLHETCHQRRLSRRMPLSSPRDYDAEVKMFAIAPNQPTAQNLALKDSRGNRHNRDKTRRALSDGMSLDYYDKEHRLSKPTHQHH